MLVIIHEFGHSMMAYVFKVPIKEIYLYPLGGISKFKMDLNENIFKEFLILVMGPIWQFIAFYILLVIFPTKQVETSVYHYSLLVFNLLPIYPLDGGRLLRVILDLFFPYKKSLQCVLFFSYLVVIVLLLVFFQLKINYIMMFISLLFIITKEVKKVNLIYQKFLLERYFNNYNFKRCMLIDDVRNFFRGRRHIIKNGGKYYTERELLEKMYKKM